MNSVANFFSGIFQIITAIFVVGVFFAFLTFSTCQTLFKNQELETANLNLERKVQALTTSLNTINNEKQVLEEGKKQHWRQVKEIEKQRDVYAQDLSKQKRIDQKQRKTIENLTTDTAELHQQVFAHEKYIEQADQERSILRENTSMLLAENQNVSNKNAELHKEANERCTAENQLWVDIEQLESKNSSLNQSVAFLEAREIHVKKGLQEIRESGVQNAFINSSCILMGILLGFLLTGYKKSAGRGQAFRLPRFSPKGTWNIVRSYFF